MTLSKRLRASPTSDIMTEAADALDAQSEDYRELYAEKVALEQIVAAQAEAIAAKDAEIARLREALKLADSAMNYMGDILNNMDAVEPEDVDATRPAFEAVQSALAQEQGEPK